MNNSVLEIIIKARDEASSKISELSGKLKDFEPQFKKMAVAGTAAFGAIAAVAASSLKEYAEDQAQMAQANQTLATSLNNLTHTVTTTGAAHVQTAKQMAATKEKTQDLQTNLKAYGNDILVTTARIHEMEAKMKSGKAMTESQAVSYKLAKEHLSELQKKVNDTNASLGKLSETAASNAQIITRTTIGEYERLQKELGGTKDVLAAVQEKMESAGKAALKLGFDDEAASAAFSKLFQVTKSTTQANKELQIAMDLARNKGIDLDAAVKILTMTHAGATKELKAQGIAIDENATAMQNIDKIAQAVTGSASAYATTAKGQWEILTNSINNTKSAIGEALAPVLASLVEKLQPVIEKVLAWIEANPELTRNIILIAGAIAALVAIIGTLGLLLPTIITGFTLLTGPIGLVILAIGALTAATILIIQKWSTIKEFFAGVWDGIKKTFKEAIDAVVSFFQPLIDTVNYLISLIEKVGNSIGNVVKQTGGVVNKAVDVVKGGPQAIGKAVSGGAAGAMNALGLGNLVKKAQGGGVSGSTPYIVGENGPEIFTPGGSGSIIPNHRMAGAGAPITINVTGTFLSEDAAEKVGDMIIQNLKRVSRIGL